MAVLVKSTNKNANKKESDPHHIDQRQHRAPTAGDGVGNALLRNAAELLNWCQCLANTATSTSKVQAVQAPKKCRNPVPVASWWLLGTQTQKPRYQKDSGVSFAVLVPER